MFSNPLDTAVFTTIYVVRHNSPILFVFHFDDGYWQFSGSEENLSDDEYMIVGLGEVILIDPSVDEVASLPIGYFASRENIDSQWITAPIKNQ
jgi:hypothetical protein